MTITFCGHGNIHYDNKIKAALYTETEKVIAAGAKRFCLAAMAISTFLQLKR